MPVMNGPALLLKLQAHPDLAAIPVIMLIVARDPHTVRQPGIHDNLSKPFQPADLLEKCRRLIKLQPLVPVG
jgi:CheY-like chemotaxis protein